METIPNGHPQCLNIWRFGGWGLHEIALHLQGKWSKKKFVDLASWSMACVKLLVIVLQVDVGSNK